MRRLALVLSVALVALGVAAAAASAMLARDPQPAGPQGVHITPLSKGTIGASVHAKAAGIEITTHGRKDMPHHRDHRRSRRFASAGTAIPARCWWPSARAR